MREDHAKHKLVHDTPNSVHGVNVQEVVLVVHKVDQEDVMHLELQVKLIAHTWDPIRKQENVKRNPVQLMEVGENGLHGRAAANHVDTDKKQNQECATVLHQHLVVEDVQDTKLFMLHATSNHVPLMVNGLHLAHGCPVVNPAEEVSKRRFENVPTQLPNMKANLVLALLL